MKPIVLLIALCLISPLFAAKKIKIIAPEKFGKRPDTIVYLPKLKQANLPLIINLHGHGSSGTIHNLYFGLHKQVDKFNFILATPNGTKDSEKHRFWNDELLELDFLHKEKGVEQPNTNDIGFLDNLIETMIGRYQIDPTKIFVVGHSNGAFMSYQYACSGKFPVHTVVPLAGSINEKIGECKRQFSIIHIHGTNDPTIKYDGDTNYFSVDKTIDFWLSHNNCKKHRTKQSEENMLILKVGNDTSITQWNDCENGKSISLWKLHNAKHVPIFKKSWRIKLLQKLISN